MLITDHYFDLAVPGVAVGTTAIVAGGTPVAREWGWEPCC
jgi:hypothetical protein